MLFTIDSSNSPMVSYRLKYNVIKPYVSFIVRDFNSRKNKYLITRYYNSLHRHIGPHTTKTKIVNRSFTKRILNTIRYKIPFNHLKYIPIAPHITPNGKFLKRRLVIKKGYFIIVYYKFKLYTTYISNQLPINPIHYIRKAFKTFPRINSNLYYGLTLFNSIASYSALFGFYDKLEHILNEEFINRIIERYTIERIEHASILALPS